MTMTRDGQPALIECREAARALYDFLDARLPGETMAAVQHHLDTCAECASHYDFARQVLAKLPDCLPLDSDCAALRARIVASLSAEGFTPRA